MRKRECKCTQRARGAYKKGNRTETAECTDHIEWRTNGPWHGTPGRDNLPHTPRRVRQRDNYGGGGGRAAAPGPPTRLAVSAGIHQQRTAPAKAVTEHSATH